jgi:hypothetical protein
MRTQDAMAFPEATFCAWKVLSFVIQGTTVQVPVVPYI